MKHDAHCDAWDARVCATSQKPGQLPRPFLDQFWNCLPWSAGTRFQEWFRCYTITRDIQKAPSDGAVARWEGSRGADIRESSCCRAHLHQRLKPSSHGESHSHVPTRIPVRSPSSFAAALPPFGRDLASVALFRASHSLFPARSPLRGGAASRLADRPPGISLAVNIRGCMSVHLSVRMVHPAVLLILRAFRWSAILRFFPLNTSF